MESTAIRRTRSWQKKMFLLMWVTYAAYYLLRVNISVAAPALMKEFSFSKVDMGLVLSSQFFLYAIGQFLNGQFGDRINARRIVTAGLLLSACMNIAFGFTGGVLTLMALLWGMNGFFQSMGWGPTVKAMSNWFPAGMRCRTSGFLGTSYIVGGALSWFLAASVIRYVSWHYTFWVPAALCILIAWTWHTHARNAPEEIGLPCVEDQECGVESGVVSRDEHIGFRRTLRITLLNPRVWVAACALFGLNIVRYGFMDWAPTYLFEKEGASVSLAAYRSIAFPAAGILGALLAGWASGRFFRNMKGPVASVMLLLLAVVCYVYPLLPGAGWLLSFVTLMFIGVLTFGPHVLIITALPADLGTRKAASSVTGFIDCIGYLGAALTGAGTGYLVEEMGWQAAFHFWIAGALLAAIMMLVLWRSESRNPSAICLPAMRDEQAR